MAKTRASLTAKIRASLTARTKASLSARIRASISATIRASAQDRICCVWFLKKDASHPSKKGGNHSCQHLEIADGYDTSKTH